MRLSLRGAEAGNSKSDKERGFNNVSNFPEILLLRGLYCLLGRHRETCLLWDKTTGEPLYRAIVWQDRRTAPQCRQLTEQGKAEFIQEHTGLVLDAYFSATKLAWLLDWVKREKPEVDLQQVIAGTVDTWVLWNLTGGKVHATDHSNASRTMLMNLAERNWER